MGRPPRHWSVWPFVRLGSQRGPESSLTSYCNEGKAPATGVVSISSGETLGFWRGREERCQAQSLQLLVHILGNLSHQRVLNPLAHPQWAQPEGLLRRNLPPSPFSPRSAPSHVRPRGGVAPMWISLPVLLVWPPARRITHCPATSYVRFAGDNPFSTPSGPDSGLPSRKPRYQGETGHSIGAVRRVLLLLLLLLLLSGETRRSTRPSHKKRPSPNPTEFH
jgi:hypothetical protein